MKEPIRCHHCDTLSDLAAVVPLCTFHAANASISKRSKCAVCKKDDKSITCVIISNGEVKFYCEEHDPFNENKL